MTKKKKPTMLALSIGDPSGIGPEVAIEAVKKEKRVLLVGDHGVIARAAKSRGIRRPIHEIPDHQISWRGSLEHAATSDALLVYQPTDALAPKDAAFGKPSIAGGRAQLRWVATACELARSGVVAGMVTGPVSKDAVIRGGESGFIGHTEYLAERCGVSDVTMAFWTEPFTSALVTTHLALAEVPAAITQPRVQTTLMHLASFLTGISRGKRVTIAVAGVNPHAGEHGRFGDEEAKAVVPAMKAAARALKGVELIGPLPVEHAFRLAQSKKVNGVVAMYHDQATLAMKLLSFGEAVNVTLGLPIVRTSVDHGTAYDIAGKGVASADGMREALGLAFRMIA